MSFLESKLLGRGLPLLIKGGLHLASITEAKAKQIIADFKRLGVQQVGHCHCSGDRARCLFRKAYAEHFVEIGVGKIINIRILNIKRR